jgi:hypothetical protein
MWVLVRVFPVHPGSAIPLVGTAKTTNNIVCVEGRVIE